MQPQLQLRLQSSSLYPLYLEESNSDPWALTDEISSVHGIYQLNNWEREVASGRVKSFCPSSSRLNLRDSFIPDPLTAKHYTAPRSPFPYRRKLPSLPAASHRGRFRNLGSLGFGFVGFLSWGFSWIWWYLDARMPQEISADQDPDDSDAEFVEIDPTGRYGRVSIDFASVFYCPCFWSRDP